MLSERENIAIAEIAVYTPFILLAIAIILRRGFSKGRPWIYLIVFCGLRISSAILVIVSANHPRDRADATWAAILGSIGLSPLFLVASGLLKIVYVYLAEKVAVKLILCHSNESIAGKTSRTRLLEMLHIPILLALILSIVGGTRISSPDSSKHSSGASFEKAGAIIFLVSYIAIAAFATFIMIECRNLPPGEKRILYTVLGSLPLLAVRLLYSLLVDFEDNSTFSIVDGNATVQLCMAIIEEIIVTIFCLLAGVVAVTTDNLANVAGGIPMNSYHDRKGTA